MRLFVTGLAFGVLAAGSAFAQNVISAHSGVVHYVEGTAYVNTERVDPKFGQFPEIKQDQEFRTEEGRAEILLTPGVFLRVAENSSIRMVSNKLTDTRVEVLTGSAMVECDDIAKDNAIMLLYKGNTMILIKRGLYRVDTNPARFQVYDGEAIVKGESGQLTLKGGKETALQGVLMAENFDKKATDDLYLWSNRRAGYLARANVSSALSMRNSGWGYGYAPSSGLLGGAFSPNGSWRWNPMFGMYTWLPYQGIGYSPFGYSLWSPYSVYYYQPTNYGGGSYGGGVVSARSPVGSAFTASQLGYNTGGARTSNTGASFGSVSSGNSGVSSGVSAGSSGGGRAGGGGVSGGSSGGRGR